MKFIIKKVEYAMYRLKNKFYESGEKTGKLLARQVKEKDFANTISAIKKDDKLVTSAKEIKDVF